MVSPTPRRCAIYTRKSSEEGLEQEFNSLHAQREACEAFVKSQAGEGWRLIKTAYDDGGFSGGSMERPALQQLLADIRERRIDVVVVYKVDRLTRALADFARMVELFDAHGVSFVSVTQQFNTTTSMGRLTLNVLLSFAQFEREVIGERIRDKIAASKRRGIWVGGGVPIGYDLRDRKMVVNEAEAQTVRQTFQRYLELGSVRRLKSDLDTRGIRSAVKVSKAGKTRGGKPFSRGALYTLLGNRIYLGEIRHKREWYPGQHELVVSRTLWEEVQERLRSQAVRQDSKTAAPPSPLAGKLFDQQGEPLYVQGAAKGHRRYRYYVSRKLVRGEVTAEMEGWRLSAPELERAVVSAAKTMLADHAAIAQAADEAGVETRALPALLKAVEARIKRLEIPAEAASAFAQLIERVDLHPQGLRVTLKLPADNLGSGADNRQATQQLTLRKLIAVQMKRRGVELRMVLKGAERDRPD